MQDLSPVMVLLVACAGAHRKPRAYEIASIVLALLGVTLLTTHGDLTAFAVSPVALIAGVACAVCVTVYNCLCPRRELRDYPVSMLQAWAFLMGAVLFELTMGPWTFGYTPSLRGVGGILFVVLFGNLLAFNLYMTGVKLIGPEKSVLYGFAEPVTAAILAVTLLNTPFTVWDIMGFAPCSLLRCCPSAGKKYAGRLDDVNFKRKTNRYGGMYLLRSCYSRDGHSSHNGCPTVYPQHRMYLRSTGSLFLENLRVNKNCCCLLRFSVTIALETARFLQKTARQAWHHSASLFFYLMGVWSLRNLPPRAATVQSADRTGRTGAAAPCSGECPL